MSLPGYKKQFIPALGYEPFEGTLNLSISDEEERKVRERLAAGSIHIDGFWQDGVLRWGADLIICRVRSSRCALIFPGNDRHRMDVLQVISDESLRQKYKLQDGDVLEIELAD